MTFYEKNDIKALRMNKPDMETDLPWNRKPDDRGALSFTHIYIFRATGQVQENQ